MFIFAHFLSSRHQLSYIQYIRPTTHGLPQTIAVGQLGMTPVHTEMLSGTNTFEISNFQEAETEVPLIRRSVCNNVALR